MTRRALLLLLALGLPACAATPPGSPEQWRAVCDAERTRRGASRLLPEAAQRPECQALGIVR